MASKFTHILLRVKNRLWLRSIVPERIPVLRKFTSGARSQFIRVNENQFKIAEKHRAKNIVCADA